MDGQSFYFRNLDRRLSMDRFILAIWGPDSDWLIHGKIILYLETAEIFILLETLEQRYDSDIIIINLSIFE